jgi:tape measure domain-containing protein
MAVISSNEIVVGYKVVGQAELQQLAAQFEKITNTQAESLEEFRKVNNQVKQNTASLKENATTGAKAGNETSKAFKDTEQSAGKLSSTLKSIGPLLAATFSIGAIVSFTKQVTETTLKYQGFQKAIDFASGSQKEGAKNFQFLSDLAKRLGLDLEATAQGYKTFAASSNLAGISSQETNRQFTAVSKAVTALGLSADDSKGVFLALGQIISKGTVSSEELRGQIGERLPGAFNIAAKSMGVTTAELGKLLQSGKLASTDFLPKFATELEKTFGPAAEKNLNSLTASQNRFNSAIDGLILSVGKKLEPFLKGAYDLAAGIANELGSIGEKSKEQTAENIGLKRAESDIAKSLIKYGGDVTVQNYKHIKQQEAILLLMGMEEKIAAQSAKATDARIQAAGEFGTSRGKIALANAEKELNILYEEEKALTKIVGIEVTTGQKKKELTDEEIKALKKQYDLRLNILNLEKQERELRGERDNDPRAKLTAEMKYLEDLLALKKQYSAKGLKVSELELTIVQEQRDIAKKKYEDSLMDNYKGTEKSEDDRQKFISEKLKAESKEREKWMKENDKTAEQYEEKEYDRLKKEEKTKKQLIEELNKQKAQANQIYYETAANSVQQLFQLQQTYLQNEMTLQAKKFDEEIRLADGNEQKITEINERRLAAEKEIRIKQFRSQQAAAIADVVFRVAPIIAQQIAGVVTAPLAIASYAAAAAQIAFILSQPVPEFYKGVENFEGGFAKVGERGSELIETPKGTFLSPDKPTLTYLPKGTNVITASKTKERMQILNSTYKKGQDQFQTIDTSPIAAELSKMPVAINRFDENGFTQFVRKGNRTTQILNKRKGY